MRPFEVEPSSWPARPTRCRPRATDFGLSTWTTRSTAPMSIPSSRLDVATRQGIRPAFRSSSIRTRCSRASEPWWARATSSSRQLVQPHGQALGEAAVVDEDDRRAVLPHELEQRRVDRGPDRAGGRLVAGGHLDAVGHHRLRQLARRAELAQVLDGDDDLEVELLARARVDELDRPVAGDEAADLRERALRRREADPLRRPLEQRVEPLERERQVRAALRPGDRRAPRRRSPSRSSAASRAPARSASGRATRAS